MKPTLRESIINLAIAIQQIPAPTFSESRRAAFIRDYFQREALQDVSMDHIGNVYARIPGIGGAAPLIVCAHIDTVFPESTDLRLLMTRDKISGPGIGDNALGTAGLFGLLWLLRERGAKLPGDVWLVANVGEEGLGDLRGMQAVVDRFGDDPLAYIILEGMALGQIYHRGLGVKRYRIRVETRGGHSWVDYRKPSAIHEMAILINNLIAIPIPDQPRSSMNIGIISGGTSVNTIACEASLELDIRSEDNEVLGTLVQHVDDVIEAANKPGEEFVLATKVIIGERPIGELSEEHPLVSLASHCLEEQGIQANRNIGSTDANIPLSRGLAAICIGLTHGGGAHTTKEYILKAPISQGMAQLLAVVERVFHELPEKLTAHFEPRKMKKG
jgi:tripeptide aminopeptidase